MSRKLIYSYRSEGTALPKYTYCKVYNDGTLVAGDGWLWPPEQKNKDEHHATMKLPRDAIRNIERIIDQNYQIFSIKKVEETIQVLDGTHETLVFSDEQQKATFRIDDLFLCDNPDFKNNNFPTPNLDLILKVFKGIREILIKNGLSEEHF